MKHRSLSAPAALLALAALLQGPAWAQPADADGDGTADATDQCPGTAAGTLVDRMGCAARIPPLPADEFPEAAAEAAAAAQVQAPLAAAASPAPAAEPVTAPAPVAAAEPAPTPAPEAAPAAVEAPAPTPVAAYEPPPPAPAPSYEPVPQPAAPIPWTPPAVALPPGVSLLPAATPSALPPPSPSLAGIPFDTGSAKLNGAARKQLDGVLAALRAQPALQLQVIGHSAAGEAGGLASARAQAVRTFLNDLGIAASRLKASGQPGGSATVEFKAL
jgi:outer membrane protein OmpA-like peptidoglycan-associated protein